MTNRARQVRASYLRARRNIEYEKLKELERSRQAKKVLDGQVVCATEKVVLYTGDLSCPNCEREFTHKSGLASHMRSKKCEK